MRLRYLPIVKLASIVIFQINHTRSPREKLKKNSQNSSLKPEHGERMHMEEIVPPLKTGR